MISHDHLAVQKHFGTFLRSRRKDKRWSMDELAERLGVSSGAVQSWEQGDSGLPIRRLPDIVNVLDITADEFVSAVGWWDDELMEPSKAFRIASLVQQLVDEFNDTD